MQPFAVHATKNALVGNVCMKGQHDKHALYSPELCAMVTHRTRSIVRC
jgi:hypothetical protein